MEIRSTDSFLAYFETIRTRTTRVVRCIPLEHLEWTCRGGEFTLGDLARHIAAVERYIFGEAIQGKPNRYPGCGRDLADGLDAVIAFMERMHRETVEIIVGLSDAGLHAKGRSVDGVAISNWKLLRAMIEHEVHHRGQMYVYLGILGVPTPSLFGLKEREVREKSLHA
jgi:uncharacterized damage-inducible protein DinB